MPYSVSSSFNYLRQQYAPAGFQRQFLIGSSDYTDKVLKWPSFTVKSDNPKPQTARVSLINLNDELGFFRNDPTNVRTDCVVKVGFNGELISLFTGKSSRVSYSEGEITLDLEDKMSQLADRIVGSAVDPVVYSSTTGTPISSFMWTMITSYGGFSNVRSAANSDVDWNSFVEWSSVFSTGGVFLEARIEGISVLEVLRRISRITDSAIFMRENKLFFRRFSITDSNQLNLDATNMISPSELSLDDDDTLNRFHTFAKYIPASRYWTVDAVAQNSASVNSFGLREYTEKDSVIWYVGSTSALDLSQRKVLVGATPAKKVRVDTAMPAIIHLVGEMITVVDNAVGLSGDTFRIMGMKVDTDRGTVSIDGNAAQIFGGFILNTSSLDGSDVLS